MVGRNQNESLPIGSFVPSEIVFCLIMEAKEPNPLALPEREGEPDARVGACRVWRVWGYLAHSVELAQKVRRDQAVKFIPTLSRN